MMTSVMIKSNIAIAFDGAYLGRLIGRLVGCLFRCMDSLLVGQSAFSRSGRSVGQSDCWLLFFF